MTRWIWAAGAVQLGIVAANVLLPKRLDLRENLGKLSPMLRQVFLVHWFYILFVLVGFSAVCFFFADELAGGSRLGRFVSGGISIFWLLRLFLQLFYYDREFRRRTAVLDATYCLALAFLGAVFALGAFGGFSQ